MPGPASLSNAAASRARATLGALPRRCPRPPLCALPGSPQVQAVGKAPEGGEPGGGLLRPRCFILSKKRGVDDARPLPPGPVREVRAMPGLPFPGPPPSSPCLRASPSRVSSARGSTFHHTDTTRSPCCVDRLTEGSRGPRGRTPACLSTHLFQSSPRDRFRRTPQPTPKVGRRQDPWAPLSLGPPSLQLLQTHGFTVHVQKGIRGESCSWAQGQSQRQTGISEQETPAWHCSCQSGVSGIREVPPGSPLFSDNPEADGSLSRPSG